MPSNGMNINPGMGRFFQQKLQESHVEVGILSCYINMIHPDLNQREELLQQFESYLENAKYFGATMVASETGCVLPDIQFTEANFTDEAFEELVVVIRRLTLVAEKHGTYLGIEAGLNHPLHSIEKIAKLLRIVDSDYLKIILDPTNLIDASNYLNQVDLVEKAYQLFGDKIIAVHLKDFIIENNEVVPTNLGDGLIKYPEILSVIKTHRPYSFVVLEETQNDKISRAVQLIEELIY